MPKIDRDITVRLDLVHRALTADATEEAELRAQIAGFECATLDDVLRQALVKIRRALTLRDLSIDTLRDFLDPHTHALDQVLPLDGENVDLFVALQEFLDHELVRPRAWEIVVPIAHCSTQHRWVHRRAAPSPAHPRLDVVSDESGAWLVVRATIANTRPSHVEERAFALADQLVGLLLAVRLLERHDVDYDDTVATLRLPPPLRYGTDDDPSPDDAPPHFRNDCALGGARAAAIRGTRPRNLGQVGLLDRLNGRTPVDAADTLVERVLTLLGDDSGRAHQIRAVAALFGRALRHDDARERAFYLGSALEALTLQKFVDGGGRSPGVTTALRANVSDGVAALLGGDEAARARNKKLAQVLYDERCLFAHGPRDDEDPHTDGAGDELVRVLIERAVLGDDAGG